MKNVISCPNCGTENPFYKLTCLNCKGYLREKIFNLDLWQQIELLIESPVKAFNRIIQSEHKNFIILITVLFSVKIFVDARFLSILFSGENSLRTGIVSGLLISAGGAFLVIWIFTVSLFFLNKFTGINTRIRDDNAVLIYSLLPYAISVIILFPIELIIFGGYLFSDNPSPFELKATVAYILLVIEILIILWRLFLSVSGIYAISRNVIYAVLIGIIYNIYLFVFTFILSITLFA